MRTCSGPLCTRPTRRVEFYSASSPKHQSTDRHVTPMDTFSWFWAKQSLPFLQYKSINFSSWNLNLKECIRWINMCLTHTFSVLVILYMYMYVFFYFRKCRWEKEQRRPRFVWKGDWNSRKFKFQELKLIDLYVYVTSIVSEWLLFNANSAIFQLYHDENNFSS
jgi:hypothetical protein